MVEFDFGGDNNTRMQPPFSICGCLTPPVAGTVCRKLCRCLCPDWPVLNMIHHKGSIGKLLRQAVLLFWLITPLRAQNFEPQRSEFESIADQLIHSRNPYLGTAQAADLRAKLATDLSPKDRSKTLAALALELIRVGKNQEATSRIDEALALAKKIGPVSHSFHSLRARVYLRLAEAENCIAKHNSDCCIFPLASGGIHTSREPAIQAKQSLINSLKVRRTFHAAWLLNLTAMALGEYPESIPVELRIPLNTFNSDYNVERFRNIAPDLNLDALSLCGGTIVEDFDSDGLLDIVVSSYDPMSPLAFYRNTGDGTFENRSTVSHLDDQLGGLNLIAGDYDNDSDVDILVLRGAWLYDDGRIRNSLLQNNGKGVFTDVTRTAGLANPAMPTQAAAWLDYDNDGDLDLYVGNESRKKESKKGDYPSQLFRNNGDGTLTDVAPKAGVTNDRYCKGVAAGDYDNDGDMDLYLSNVGPNRLYRNEGNGTFTDIAPDLGLIEPAQRSFAPWFFDVDNDGWLDIFVSAYDANLDDIAAEALGLPHKASFPRLYHNNRDGTFNDIADRMNLQHPYLPMGANFGDIDHDGWLDIYLGTGDPNFDSLMPNVMLRNKGGRIFQDVTVSGGLGHLQKGHGIAFADLDNDGDQDIFHQLGGFYPGDKFKNALFENPNRSGHFIYIKLNGTQTNRSGVGARLTLMVDMPDGERTIHRAVGSVSSFGGSPLRQEIGLGDAESIRSLKVFWPVSKTTQTFTNVPLDTFISVTEGEERLQKHPLNAFSFKTVKIE